MSITGIVQNDTIKLPIHVPDGTRVEITLPEKKALTMTPDELGRLAEQLAGENDPERARLLMQEMTAGFYGKDSDA